MDVWRQRSIRQKGDLEYQRVELTIAREGVPRVSTSRIARQKVRAPRGVRRTNFSFPLQSWFFSFHDARDGGSRGVPNVKPRGMRARGDASANGTNSPGAKSGYKQYDAHTHVLIMRCIDNGHVHLAVRLLSGGTMAYETHVTCEIVTEDGSRCHPPTAGAWQSHPDLHHSQSTLPSSDECRRLQKHVQTLRS